MKANIPPPQPACVPMMTMMVVQVVDLHGQSASLSPYDVIGVLGKLMQQLSKTAQGEVFMLAQENDTVFITAGRSNITPGKSNITASRSNIESGKSSNITADKFTDRW